MFGSSARDSAGLRAGPSAGLGRVFERLLHVGPGKIVSSLRDRVTQRLDSATFWRRVALASQAKFGVACQNMALHVKIWRCMSK